MHKDQLPDHTYYQSQLVKSGVRLHINIIDTVCRRGLSYTFWLCVFIFLILQFAPYEHLVFDDSRLDEYKIVIHLLLAAYIILYGLRYVFCLRVRLHLRRTSQPIAVETYAVVILDSKKIPFCPLKSAIVYKESGTKSPKFYTGPVRGRVRNFAPERVAVIFRHHKNEKYFTIDDENAYQTSSAKAKIFRNLEFADLPEDAVKGKMIGKSALKESNGGKVNPSS